MCTQHMKSNVINIYSLPGVLRCHHCSFFTWSMSNRMQFQNNLWWFFVFTKPKSMHSQAIEDDAANIDNGNVKKKLFQFYRRNIRYGLYWFSIVVVVESTRNGNKWKKKKSKTIELAPIKSTMNCNRTCQMANWSMKNSTLTPATSPQLTHGRSKQNNNVKLHAVDFIVLPVRNPFSFGGYKPSAYCVCANGEHNFALYTMDIGQRITRR